MLLHSGLVFFLYVLTESLRGGWQDVNELPAPRSLVPRLLAHLTLRWNSNTILRNPGPAAPSSGGSWPYCSGLVRWRDFSRVSP